MIYQESLKVWGGSNSVGKDYNPMSACVATDTSPGDNPLRPERGRQAVVRVSFALTFPHRDNSEKDG